MKKSKVFCSWDDENYAGEEYDSSNTQTLITPKETESTTTKSTLAVVPKQLQSTDLITCRDKLANAVFSADSSVLWEDVISGKVPLKIIEKEWRTIYPPKGKPQTISKSIATVTVQLGIREAVDECIKRAILTERPGEFDRIVLEACMTHQYHGQFGIAISTIFKYMGGQGEVPPTIRQTIWNSIDKMRHIDMIIDATEAYQKLERLHNTDGTPKRKPSKVVDNSSWVENYVEENEQPQSLKKSTKSRDRYIIKGYLLPAEDVSMSCNGIEFEGIRFLDVSPVFAYAKDKGETDVISQRLLQAAKRRATKNFIALKSYILGRTRSIQRNQDIGNDTLKPTITVNALYNNCGDPEKAKTDSKFRTRIRKVAVEYMQTLVEVDEIASFICLDKNNHPCVNLTHFVKIQLCLHTSRKKSKC